jgi:hypothetical protein
MKLDDAELEKRIKEAGERRKKIDELRIAVLEGHLIMEEQLENFLSMALFNPSHVNLERLNFHMKGNLALALALGEDKDAFWSIVWALNQLRNKIAHERDAKEIEEKMAYLRKTYIAALHPRQGQDAEKQTNKEIVDAASALCAGLFAALAMGAKGRRAVIDQHWKARSEI